MNRCLGCGWDRKTGFCYFLTSVGGDYFRFIARCKHTRNIGWEWSSGSQTSLTSRYFLFRSRFDFRFYLSCRRDTYSSGLPCAWPIVTMAEVGSGRVSSLGRVTTGIGSAKRGDEEKLNSLGTSSWSSWLGLSISVSLLSNRVILR